MIPLCREERIAVIPWSPLARGFLTGRYKRGEPAKSTRYDNDQYLSGRYFRPEDFDIVESVVQLAKEKGVEPAQIALSWLLHKGVTAPIIGATKVKHVEEAVGALEVKLDPDEIKVLEARYRPHEVTGHQ